MRAALNEMTIKANTADVLTALRKNRETHAQIVAEAKEGYLKKARETLERELERMKKATSPVALTVHLTLPQDYTKAYDIAIRMLELHTGTEIELTSGQVQHLIMDDWDWKQSFLVTNSAYSATAAHMPRE